MILEVREASADDIAAACELWLRAEAARTGVPAMADAARELAGSMLAVEPQYWGCSAGSRMLAELTTRLSELIYRYTIPAATS